MGLGPDDGAIPPNDPAVQREPSGQDLIVLAAIDAQLHSPPRTGNGFLVLALSLVAFLGVGYMQWDLTNLGLIAVALVLHELGHVAAMKLSGYQNVRMFFIPFFGAAVTGRNLNAPGWIKVLVSLSGPLPGILLGAAFCVVAIVTSSKLMATAAAVLLWLNGINLLPVLPLDGGWVVHVLLFSRHPIIDLLFRLGAVITVFVFAIQADAKVFMVVGALMAAGIPLSFTLAKIAAGLRREGWADQARQAGHADDMPPALALAALARIREALPTTQAPHLLARHTIDVVEIVNARPPGWALSALLLVIQLGGMVMSLIFYALVSSLVR